MAFWKQFLLCGVFSKYTSLDRNIIAVCKWWTLVYMKTWFFPTMTQQSSYRGCMKYCLSSKTFHAVIQQLLYVTCNCCSTLFNVVIDMFTENRGLASQDHRHRSACPKILTLHKLHVGAILFFNSSTRYFWAFWQTKDFMWKRKKSQHLSLFEHNSQNLSLFQKLNKNSFYLECLEIKTL